MKKKMRRYAMSGAVLSLALATGFIMQNGDQIASLVVGADDETVVVGAAPTELTNEPQPVVVAGSVSLQVPAIEIHDATMVEKFRDPEAIELASAEGINLPSDPMSGALPLREPGDLAKPMSPDAQPSNVEVVEGQTRISEYGLPCAVELTAVEGLGGMVDLMLSAPCYANAPVTITHEALHFTEATDEVGVLKVSVPALAEKARFELQFDTGTSALAEAEVSVFRLMSHAAIQWQGATGMQIHAFEYGSDYGQEGHISVESPHSAHRADRVAGGFLTRLGTAEVPGAWMAEVYSFPVGAMSENGVVRINIEAEVSTATCGREVRAETIQPDGSGTYKKVELTLAMPDCDAMGDFLVLNNILKDMEIAAN